MEFLRSLLKREGSSGDLAKRGLFSEAINIVGCGLTEEYYSYSQSNLEQIPNPTVNTASDLSTCFFSLQAAHGFPNLKYVDLSCTFDAISVRNDQFLHRFVS